MLKRSIIINPIYGSDIDSMITPALNSIVENGYFSVVEMWDSHNQEFWAEVKNFIPYINFDVSISILMHKNKLSIVDIDKNNRATSLQYIFQRIDYLASIGVKDISVSSPMDVDKRIHEESILILVEVLIDICKYANELGVRISFEPFDRDFHKHRLIGTTAEFLELSRLVKRECGNFHLIWDTAHVYLQERHLTESLRESAPFIKRIHMANACCDESKWFYGDCHIPFGKIGDIACNNLKTLYLMAKEAPQIESVAIEVATNNFLEEVNSFQATINHIEDVFKYIE